MCEFENFIDYKDEIDEFIKQYNKDNNTNIIVDYMTKPISLVAYDTLKIRDETDTRDDITISSKTIQLQERLNVPYSIIDILTIILNNKKYKGLYLYQFKHSNKQYGEIDRTSLCYVRYSFIE